MRARDQLVSRLGWDEVAFLIDNDANLGALAEYVWGAGRWAASRRPSPPPTPPIEDMLYIEGREASAAGSSWMVAYTGDVGSPASSGTPSLRSTQPKSALGVTRRAA